MYNKDHVIQYYVKIFLSCCLGGMNFTKVHVYICCNMAVRDLTDIYVHTTPERPMCDQGEYGYISKTLSTTMLQHLCNVFVTYIPQFIVVYIASETCSGTYLPDKQLCPCHV